jgi:hypothetical protein
MVKAATTTTTLSHCTMKLKTTNMLPTRRTGGGGEGERGLVEGGGKARYLTVVTGRLLGWGVKVLKLL